MKQTEIARTSMFVAGAAVLVALSLLVRPGGVENALFSDEGEPFFPAFTEPQQAVDLEVWEFREATKEAVPFKVKQDQGRWTIPSHYDYPADAKTRMAKAASLLIGLKKERVISDRKEDHAALGVLDPKEESPETTGRGKRITFKDGGSSVLADLVIGKEVEGKTDFRYVRVPDKRRVYAVRLSADLSTRFEDWIERDLLKTGSWDITGITFDNYSVDEQRGEVVPGETLVVNKDQASKWVLQGLGASEETNEDRVREAADTLGQLKIVGVRPKPKGLTAALEQATGFDRAMLMEALARRGYFVGPKGRLFSNEGDVLVQSRKGVAYTLKFGEIVYGTGEQLTAGTEPPKPADGEPGDKPADKPAEGSHRYLMITAQFDEALLQKPDKLRLTDEQLDKRKQARAQVEAIVKAIDAWKTKHEGKLPASLAELTQGEEPPLKEMPKDPWGEDYALEVEGDTFVVIARGEDKHKDGDGAAADVRSDKLAMEDELRKAADDWKAWDTKVQEGKKEAETLTQRFGPWYYVIDAKEFAKLKPVRKDLAKEKTEKPAAGEGGDKDK